MSKEQTDNQPNLNAEQNPPAPPIDDPDGSIERRFLSKVVCDIETGCWEWTAGTTRHGYGSFWLNGRNRQAHRVYFRLVYGGIPAGHQVRHTCDNPACVYHVVLGTPRDNVLDAVRRGRHVRGTIRHDGFSPEEIRDIRRRATRDDVTQRELAREYDTTDPTISRIVRRKFYDYID